MIYRITLMHKNDRVCNLIFDERGNLDKITRIINPELLPLPARKDISLLKEWCCDRAVPKTRHHIERLVPANITSGVYMLDNLGLSLTDTYWFLPYGETLKWEDVNLFKNDFSSAIIKKEEDVHNIANRTYFSKFSPDAATKGDLEKKWLIKDDGTRFLVKGNYGVGCQQSLNESFVTLLNEKQQSDIPFVSYKPFEFTFHEEAAICCASDNFITDDSIEFISGYDIFQSQKIKGSRSCFYQVLDGCKKIGLDEQAVRNFFDYEILLDYLITNTDRHMNNFGVIRNSDTLEAIQMAPIYDSGSSLFWQKASPVVTMDTFKKIKTHSFLEEEDRLLRYVQNANAFDLSKLPNEQEIIDIYSFGNTLPEERIRFILQCYNYKVEKLERFQYRKIKTGGEGGDDGNQDPTDTFGNDSDEYDDR